MIMRNLYNCFTAIYQSMKSWIGHFVFSPLFCVGSESGSSRLVYRFEPQGSTIQTSQIEAFRVYPIFS